MTPSSAASKTLRQVYSPQLSVLRSTVLPGRTSFVRRQASQVWKLLRFSRVSRISTFSTGKTPPAEPGNRLAPIARYKEALPHIASLLFVPIPSNADGMIASLTLHQP
ncbi:hypothetical protein NDU88_001984 [Pleurodeles waltl]|uniref:Uncharacterized protein n=1 Tax=Pleurodeles waltl TaxID=8319 RepID=A0AAV7W1N1_PLEWA|nr:hypothetical protein NDU88_001984 [Pleurodeles waltl]